LEQEVRTADKRIKTDEYGLTIKNCRRREKQTVYSRSLQLKNSVIEKINSVNSMRLAVSNRLARRCCASGLCVFASSWLIIFDCRRRESKQFTVGVVKKASDLFFFCLSTFAFCLFVQKKALPPKSEDNALKSMVVLLKPGWQP
jgi:hypothetical protein